VIVEFIGPEGAGKTTLIERVRLGLSQRGHPVATIDLGKRSPGEIARRSVMGLSATENASRSLTTREKLRTAMQNPRLVAWCALGASLRPMTRSRAYELNRVRPLWAFRRVFWRDAALRSLRMQKSILLVDEGPRHRLLNLATDGRLRLENRIFKAITKPDLIVVVDVDPFVALERLARRGTTIFARKYRHPRLSDDELLIERVRRYRSLTEGVMVSVPAASKRWIDSTHGVTEDVIDGLISEISTTTGEA
jgi:thymidylate kinase